MRARIWTVFMVLAAAVSLTSCTWMYMDSDDTAHIEAKRSIRPFSHLKEPIVVTMPVYSSRHLFGNKSWDSMQDQKGDIFVVIDLATDTVWDWIFFPGKHGWTNWRCVEAGSSPTLYCSAGMGSGLVGCLDPHQDHAGRVQCRNQGRGAKLQHAGGPHHHPGRLL